MANKKSSIVVGLFVTTAQDGYFFHIHARPVIVGLRASDLADIDNGRAHEPVSPDRISNFSSYSEDINNGLFLDDLLVSCQGGTCSGEERRLYAFETSYRNVSLDASNVARYASTLKTIAGRLDKLTDRFGYPADFTGYLARVAEAIGASRFVFSQTSRGSSYSDNTHRIVNIKDGLYRVTCMETAWIDAGKVSA